METVGRYQLQEKLGQGGMGVVYRAFDSVLERTVALKLVLPTDTLDSELKTRLFREARSAGNLKHKSIVTIYDLGEHEGRPYLAMELLEGEDLQRRLSRPERMSLRHKIDLSIEICEGLAYAHAHGVVHRDIKPANIFITDQGGAKLLDFGLARLMTSQLTRSNMLMGTLNYMAPEQVRGERADHRSDIFSTGVVLYELFGGRKAFEGDSVAATLYKILQEVPEPLSKIDAALPQELASIIECMLAKLPDERYPTMDAVCRDLEMYRATYRLGPMTPVPSPISSVRDVAPPVAAPASAPIAASTAPLATSSVATRRFWTRAAIVAATIITVAAAGIWTFGRRSPSSAAVVTSPAAPQPSAHSTAAPAPDPQTANAPLRQPETAGAVVSDATPRGTRTPAKAGGSMRTREPSPAPGRPSAATSTPASSVPQQPAQASAPEPAAPPTPPSAPPPRPDRPPATADAAPTVPAPVGPPSAALGATPAQPISAPPTSTTPPASPPEAAVGAEQRVTELLDRYKEALESRNIDQVKRIWPTLGASEEAAIRQEFQHAARIAVTIDRPQIVVSGSTGRVSFVRNYNLITVDGQRLRSTTSAVMDVRRSGNTWVIETIRFAER